MTSARVTLALQGGASLGAYTWGVLDVLLEDERLDIEGVTGASAGAINAVALASGLAAAGREGARRTLRATWEGLAKLCEQRRRRRLMDLGALVRSLLERNSRRALFEFTTRIAADFEMDPETMQPLRGALEKVVDFAWLRDPTAIRVFVNATALGTRTMRVFSNDDVSVDAVCASCCVPLLFAPVAIGGEFFWDGGFFGNPAIYPVLYGCESCDVVLVETRAPALGRPPTTAREILSLMVELGSTAGLVRELRMIDFVSELVREARAPLRPGLREVRVHAVPPHPGLASFEGAASFRADLPYLHRLHDLGREAGRSWLAKAAVTEGGSLACAKP